MKQAHNKAASISAEATSLEVLIQHYMMVSQCWANPARAVKFRMTVEKALSTLRYVRDMASTRSNGKRLSLRAHKLLMEIVDHQVDRNMNK